VANAIAGALVNVPSAARRDQPPGGVVHEGVGKFNVHWERAAMSDTETAATAEQAAQTVEAWISGDPAKMERASRPDNGAPEHNPGAYVPDPGKDDAPPAPKGEAALVEHAATTLSQLGPEGEALVQEWGGHTSADFKANMAYAKSAFADIVANRPDLIAKVDSSGLGNDPAVLKLLAQHGRMQANTLGDYTVERNRNPSFDEPRPRGQSAAQAEWNKLYKDNPPGSAGHRSPEVQKRIGQLAEIISGGGNIAGQGGRTA
jgi:hypothetical protein